MEYCGAFLKMSQLRNFCYRFRSVNHLQKKHFANLELKTFIRQKNIRPGVRFKKLRAGGKGLEAVRQLINPLHRMKTDRAGVHWVGKRPLAAVLESLPFPRECGCVGVWGIRKTVGTVARAPGPGRGSAPTRRGSGPHPRGPAPVPGPLQNTHGGGGLDPKETL